MIRFDLSITLDYNVLVPSDFVFIIQPTDMFRNRAGARRSFYTECLNHRWSWENPDSEEAPFNYRCMFGLSELLGYNGHSDRFLLHVGWAEAYVTELWPFLR